VPGLIWNDRCQSVFVGCFVSTYSFSAPRTSVQACPTMNQSDIRGLSRQAEIEPTLIFFVGSIMPSKVVSPARQCEPVT
jgi:hypothetical protein